MVPKGFLASAINCGIKKDGSPDLALFISEGNASGAGVFTRNRIKAAPVIISKKILPSFVRAVLVNSGNANAYTGFDGIKRAEMVSKKLSEITGFKQNEILLASTGVIGVNLPHRRIINHLKILFEKIRRDGFNEAKFAIMTTDSFPKMREKRLRLSGGRSSILGIAKGAGMICPDMATMLSFIFTDVEVSPQRLNRYLHRVVDSTFNRITVDGDMSTNDTVFILANGMSGCKIENKKDEDIFICALYEVSAELAKDIVRDGEGSTKMVEIKICGAKTKGDAIKIGYRIANSQLVKTAFYGADVNWGRIIAAAGASGAFLDPEKIELKIGDIYLIKKGRIMKYDEGVVRKVMKRREFSVTLNLNIGSFNERVITSDLTEKYIEINSSYRS